MTINTITPFSGYEAQRLEQLEQQRQEAQKSPAAQEGGTDRISISEEGRLKASRGHGRRSGDHSGGQKAKA